MNRESAILFGVLPLALTAGCGISGQDYAQVQRELLDTQEQVRKLQQQIAAQEQTVALMKSQVATARDTNPETLAQWVVPVKLSLASQSGGYDEDGKPGDDGLILYLQPIDRDEHVIKAAGSIKVTLLDLANPPEQYLVGEYVFDASKTRELWSGRLWTNHFTVRCPWYQGKPPAHHQITARAEFTDLLTGRKLDAQAVYTIEFPPGHVTGTASQ